MTNHNRRFDFGVEQKMGLKFCGRLVYLEEICQGLLVDMISSNVLIIVTNTTSSVNILS